MSTRFDRRNPAQGGRILRTLGSSEEAGEQPQSGEPTVKKIVTTLPSATEIVSLLGLEDRLVGITHECDFPPSVRSKPVIMRSVFDSAKMASKEIADLVDNHVRNGRSIYEIDERLLRSIGPDLIITQELCEVCATPLQIVAKAISRLEPKPRVISLTPHSLEDILINVTEVGDATGKREEANKVVESLEARIERVKDRCSRDPKSKKRTVFCMEWLDPIYCSGHWMPEMVGYAGGVEVIGRAGEPSTAVPWESVLAADPEVIFVAVCSYPVEKTLSEISALTRRKGWQSLRAVKGGQVYVLDSASYFSRSGPRLVDGLEIMAYLLNPDLFPDYELPPGSAFSLKDMRYVGRLDRGKGRPMRAESAGTRAGS